MATRYRVEALLIVLTAITFLLVIYPTFYLFDSSELTIGAATLGIAHAPGYALYLLSAHLFTLLPLGDVGFRANLFSVVCVVLSAPLIYSALTRLAQNKAAAFATTTFFLWTFSTWNNGTIAEVYASQLLTLALCLYALCRLAERVTPAAILAAAISYGVAVAMHPSSIFFAPAVALAFIGLKVPVRWCLIAGAVAFAIFAASLLYFPLRQHAALPLDLAGSYDEAGTFHPVDLGSISGLWWLLSGQQFSAFFPAAMLPSAEQIRQMAGFLWENLLGVGVVLGGVGMVGLFRRPRLLIVWLLALLPYLSFYTLYGAPDRDTMLGPVYLLWCLPMCLGLAAVERGLPQRLRPLIVLLPLIPFVANLPPLIQRNHVSTRVDAQAVINALPQNAIVFGLWGDLMPVQYLQVIEGQRADLDLRNLILFSTRETVIAFVRRALLDPAAKPIVFLGKRAPIGLDTRLFNLIPFRTTAGGPTLGYQLQRRAPQTADANAG